MTTIEYNSTKYRVVIMFTRGLQYDLFTPNNNEDRNVNTLWSWNDDIFIENLDNSTKVRLTTGSLAYIHYFGFYEGGGDENIYRNSPEKLAKLLNL